MSHEGRHLGIETLELDKMAARKFESVGYLDNLLTMGSIATGCQGKAKVNKFKPVQTGSNPLLREGQTN